MKTIIKIGVALLLVTAAFNAGRAALNNYSFEDAVHEGMLFDARATDAELVEMVMKLATEYDVPLEQDDITIRSQGSDLIIEMTYTDTVVLVPGIFQREWTFHPSASTKVFGKR